MKDSPSSPSIFDISSSFIRAAMKNNNLIYMGGLRILVKAKQMFDQHESGLTGSKLPNLHLRPGAMREPQY